MRMYTLPRISWLFCLAFIVQPSVLRAQAIIAPTDPNPPEAERKTFKLPPGFEAQLVASEPDILKPIQLCFDGRGRLWVSTTTEYPFPAKGRPGTDRLVILEDFGVDGKARKITTFADNLNIPIGVCPLPDGKSALVTSIDPGDEKTPSACWIWKLTDTDGDGKADKQEKLYGPFGVRDTHGMTNSFLLMPDGWVYACHGFLNDSKVKGKDGHEIEMNSGNTYRFRPDGSRIEIWTRGQVNPFGLAVDPFFNLYTADCHSRPITQLIRGATYTSFSKPHDGLGFAPDMINHDHGSTALCGLTWYDADQFPAEFKGTMFLGNVVTNRINFDKIEFVGSTPKAIQKPDFLVSSDLWFRPTDIKLGPDGALYVADFYNKIIGHYEVDLKHPGRDRFRGRVWRIVWKGLDGKAPAPKMAGDCSRATPAELLAALDSPNLTVRLHATRELQYRAMGAPANATDKATELQAAQLLWLGQPKIAANYADTLTEIAKRYPDSTLLQVQALRVIIALPEWTVESRRSLLDYFATTKPNPILARVWLEALTAHPHPDNIRAILGLLANLPAGDSHLRHAARVALREQFRDGTAYAKLPLNPWTDADTLAVADVSLAIRSREAAIFLLRNLELLAKKGDRLAEFVAHTVRYGEEAKTLPVMLALVQSDSATDLKRAIGLFQTIERSTRENGKHLEGDAVLVAEKLVVQCLDSADNGVFQAGAEVAGAMKSAKAFPILVEKLTGKVPEARALAILPALAAIDAGQSIPLLGKTLMNSTEPIVLRERAAQLLAGINQPQAFDMLLKAVAVVPSRLETTIGIGMASSPAGAERLLQAVETGKASARLLQEKAVQGKLNDAKVPKWQERVATLTKGLPSADQRVQELLKNRAVRFGKEKSDATRGLEIFTKNCAACHQIAGKGNKIGPQLDGLGVRGLERILEDILDPNRNVDQAFRATTLSLKDGKNLMGLVIREEGQVVVMADDKGKEVRINKDDIESRRQSILSPMPANFDQAILEKDFYDLMAYLLSQRVKQ